MATIAITAANVKPSASAFVTRVKRNDGTPTVAHEAVAQGQTAYVFGDGTYGLADANAASPACNCVGIFENAAAAGQVCSIISSDPALVIGGALTLGKVLICGATPGQIVESGDAVTGWHICTLGVCQSATVLALQISPLASDPIT